MEPSYQSLVQSGGREQLLEDFRAVAETTTFEGISKYGERPTMVWLARFVVGQAGGPNKDMPLLELCHLVNAVEASCDLSDGLTTFFIGLDCKFRSNTLPQ